MNNTPGRKPKSTDCSRSAKQSSLDLIFRETKSLGGRLTAGGQMKCRQVLDTMSLHRFLHERYQFRLVLCGHKVAEAGAACLVLMVQGQLSDVTLAHLLIASKTGLLAVVPILGITFTHYARHFINRWTSSLFLGICTFAADAAIHPSHYQGQYTEAALTGVGAFVFSILISLSPIGKQIEELAEALLLRHHAVHKS